MANWYGLGAGTPGNWMNVSTIADIDGPGSSPMLTSKTCSKEKRREDVTEKEDGHHVPRKAQQSTPVQPSEGARKWRQRGGSYAAPVAGYGTPLPSPPASSPHPTPTQPAWLAQQSLGSRRFRAIIIKFPLLLIPNGIILFLGDECFHWPLLLVWHVQSSALDTSPLSWPCHPSKTLTERG